MLKTVLDSILGEKRPVRVAHLKTSKLTENTPLEACPKDFSEMCDHDHKITPYMKAALFAMPNTWIQKHAPHGVGECVFVTQREYFTQLDAKCRGEHLNHPKKSISEIVRMFV